MANQNELNNNNIVVQITNVNEENEQQQQQQQPSIEKLSPKSYLIILFKKMK